MVEWDGLENRCTGNGTVGSNPTLSAINLIDQAVTKFAHLITHPGRGLSAFFSVGKPDLI